MEPRKTMECLIVGTMGFDTVETPSETRKRQLGGSAYFSAIGASLFAPVRLVASAGYDFTEEDQQAFAGKVINLDGVYCDPARPTFTWHGRYTEGFEERDTDDLQNNALDYFEPTISKEAADCPFALICNFDPDVQAKAINKLPADRFFLLDTIEKWIDEKRSAFLELALQCGLLVINNQEAEKLTETKDIKAAGQMMLDWGIAAVIIKQGDKGSHLFHPEGEHKVGICPAEAIIDPTGAGDTYAGTILGYITSRADAGFESIKEAMTWGAAAASFTIESFSAERLASVSLAEVEARRKTL
ncbi:PfkB family carbohydrate kinase [Rubellicoccus peritrichatus]|uniref:PfkB family carbohydrate kinase n=1 Tax=Rubellicoccus peritrichatus TaxID=3080537 RepID=A0AAQ3L914_9BACT|nr:PfkB family carbohydrate kinase [Puniceicoccus sp. CR14]WOO39520.1 PfkB family carbohydrate kinase [Puniceicoccus sp. CR14]